MGEEEGEEEEEDEEKEDEQDEEEEEEEEDECSVTGAKQSGVCTLTWLLSQRYQGGLTCVETGVPDYFYTCRTLYREKFSKPFT